MNCEGRCVISGDLEAIKKLAKDLKKDMKMGDIVTLKEDTEEEKSNRWGSARKFNLIGHLMSPDGKLYVGVTTDSPSELFWRNLSWIYKVEVNYTFINLKKSIAGNFVYEQGKLADYEIECGESSSRYQKLKEGVLRVFNIEEPVKRISIKEIKKRRGVK